MQILISWIGDKDIKLLNNTQNPGPLISIIRAGKYDHIHLLNSQSPDIAEPIKQAILNECSGHVQVHPTNLTSPIHFGDIYEALDGLLAKLSESYANPKFTIQLTSGTPAMSAVSILVGKTKYATSFVQNSREQGVQKEDIPFDIAADFLPHVAKRQEQKISELFLGHAPNTAAFDDILSQSPVMETLKKKAAILATRNVPVLIYGETGTGKELFAKAIHNASARAAKPMVSLNCGAIPKDLIDATLFGYVKGAFSGALKDTPGFFCEANGGTLFLDEFGELPLDSQVRLLRVLQEGAYNPVGSTKEKTTDVRIITATNKNLVDEVAAGKFREDLFYRIAIGVLQLPPLRERVEDILLLAKHMLSKFAGESELEQNCEGKKISVKARKFMKSYLWPGNVRELQATLLRATLWHISDTLSDSDIRGALLNTSQNQQGILNRDISQGIDLNELCDSVARHYIPLAIDAAQGRKTKAAELLGLNNYQTLENKMKKLKLN